MAQSDTSHVDRTLMMRDHVHPEVYIRVASEWQSHITHHACMSDFVLADGWRIWAGAAVRSVTFVSMTMVLRRRHPPSAHHKSDS